VHKVCFLHMNNPSVLPVVSVKEDSEKKLSVPDNSDKDNGFTGLSSTVNSSTIPPPSILTDTIEITEEPASTNKPVVEISLVKARTKPKIKTRSNRDRKSKFLILSSNTYLISVALLQNFLMSQSLFVALIHLILHR